MAGTQASYWFRFVALLGGGSLGGPFRVVLVLEDQGDRAPDGDPTPHPAGDPRDIRLDLLPAAAAVPALTACQVAAQVFLRDFQSRGHAFDDHGQLWTVRFPGSPPSQH